MFSDVSRTTWLYSVSLVLDKSSQWNKWDNVNKAQRLDLQKKKKAVSKTFLFQIITFQRRFLITGIVFSTTTGGRKKSPSNTLLREIFPTWKTSQYCLSTGDLIPGKSYVYTCFTRLINKGDLTDLAQLAIECSQKYSI